MTKDSYVAFSTRYSVSDKSEDHNNGNLDLSTDDSVSRLNSYREGESSLTTLRRNITQKWDRTINSCVGTVIIINALFIGLETDWGEEHFAVWEHVFLVFYCAEMAIRMIEKGVHDYFGDPWCIFDFVLVTAGVIDAFASRTQAANIHILRTIRMARVLRVVRLFHVLKDLNVIIKAFARAFQRVMWIGSLICILDYICAVFLTKTVGHAAHEYGDLQPEVEMWFGTIGKSMRTLFIVMTLAEWDDIAMKLSDAQPQYEMLIFMFFIAYIMVAAYTMVSLVTGVICEALLDAQHQDHANKMKEIDEERRRLENVLRDLLGRVDLDGSGSLSIEEVENALESTPDLLKRLAALDIDVTMHQIRGIVERVGGIDGVRIEHFVEELTNLTGGAKASSVVELKHKMMFQMYDMGAKIDKMSHQLNQLLGTPDEDVSVKKTGTHGSRAVASSNPSDRQSKGSLVACD